MSNAARIIRIGVSDCPRYPDFEQWMLRVQDIEIIHLGYNHRDVAWVHRCHGILLTGGQDIHPSLYGKPETYSRLDPAYVDERRDAFECAVIEHALNRQTPIFGICRGLQMVNVFLGGTMITDLESDRGIAGHTRIKEKDQEHSLEIFPQTPLHTISGSMHHYVNSAHHQAVESPGTGLLPVAWSSDGTVIESIHWEDPQAKPWMLLVQWHPERMADQHNPMASSLRAAFVNACREHAV